MTSPVVLILSISISIFLLINTVVTTINAVTTTIKIVEEIANNQGDIVTVQEKVIGASQLIVERQQQVIGNQRQIINAQTRTLSITDKLSKDIDGMNNTAIYKLSSDSNDTLQENLDTADQALDKSLAFIKEPWSSRVSDAGDASVITVRVDEVKQEVAALNRNISDDIDRLYTVIGWLIAFIVLILSIIIGGAIKNKRGESQ